MKTKAESVEETIYGLAVLPKFNAFQLNSEIAT